jgi:Lipocalin-like domain
MTKTNVQKMMGLFMLVLIGLASCKKSSDNISDCSITMKNLAGNYKLTAVIYKASATATEQNFFPIIDACEKDDVLELKDNGTFNLKDVGAICTPNNSSIGTWNLVGNQITCSNADILTGTISGFNCKELTYFVNNAITTGDKMVFTYTK